MKTFLSKTPIVSLAVSAIMIFPSVGHAGLFSNEVKVPWSNVPAVVQKTIADHADHGKVDRVEKEVKHNKTIYEAEIKTPTNQRLKLKVAEDGKLVELRYKNKEETEIPWNQVPKVVQQAFTANAQNGKIRTGDVEIESRHGIMIYEGVADMPNKGTIEMKVSSDGKLIRFKREEE